MRSMLAAMILLVLPSCASASGPDPSGSTGSASTGAPLAAATVTASASAVASASPTAGGSASSAPVPAATADPRIGTGPRDVDEVVPGVSIGPVKLGMTEAELKTLGLWVRPFHPKDPAPVNFLVGPYEVVLTDGRVSSIESTVTNMPKGLRIRGQVLGWRSKFEAVAAAFEGCEPKKRMLCGDQFRCEGKKLLVKSACSLGLVHVQIFAEPLIYPWEKSPPGGHTD